MIETEIEIATPDGSMDTFITHPEEGGPFPAIIFYMDAPGIREELRDMARRLATVGYYVMLPNMYYRTGREGGYGFNLAEIRTDPAELQKMFGVMNSLTNALVVSDTGPMLDHIAAAPAADAGRVGSVGYCMSGRYVIAAGAAFPELFKAIASYYGVGIITDQPNSAHLTADRIKGEVYLAFAEQDEHVPEHVLAALPGVMSAAGVTHRIEVYPGTGHGFAFPERAAYVKQAGERHWERLFALYDRTLRGR
ncbi:dienelactone hydrolase family protein [Rhodobacteraceae bacterium NNCM2]|nr:dienelactone hydrolase family protein [Coraliihabitans acroporae]